MGFVISYKVYRGAVCAASAELSIAESDSIGSSDLYSRYLTHVIVEDKFCIVNNLCLVLCLSVYLAYEVLVTCMIT